MPRVIKHPDIRRAELLDRASALFVQHGYDNVSLNDLIAAAGVSKGAFYHWFPSKDELITALAERSARDHVHRHRRGAGPVPGQRVGSTQCGVAGRL